MANADVASDHISREAGDTQKGIRFQKLRAATRFLARVEANAAGRVYCAIELLEDSLVIDGSSDTVLSGEENKLYSSALSLNSPAIKNTLVAFLDLTCAFQQSDELRLGVYASAKLADERLEADVCAAVGFPPALKMCSILKGLVQGRKLSVEEQQLARHIAIEEYKKQYAKKDKAGFLGLIEKWSVERFGRFLEQIDWSISPETNAELEAEALRQVRSSRFFNHRHEGLDKFILSRLLDELEKRSHSRSPLDRLVSTSDVELIFMLVVGDVKLGTSSKPPPDGHPNSPGYGHLKLPHLN